MATNKKNYKSQVKQGRYIVLLEGTSTSSISNAEKSLDKKLVSSEELGSGVKAAGIMGANTGIIYKNLGVAVVDDISEEKLKEITSASGNPVVYWEKEREFHPVTALDELGKVKQTASLLQQQIDQLETTLKDGQQKDDVLGWESATWGIKAINLMKEGYTGKGVLIACLDTGFYLSHPDFEGRNITGKSFIEGEEWDFDGNGHGTHIAGTAGGNVNRETNNRYGVANEADLLIGKVLSDVGSGSTSGIIDAIDWAIEKGARIVSMSLGSSVAVGDKPSPIFEQVGRRALEANCLLIAASGNDSRRPGESPKPVGSPANAESIMAVAALDEQLKVAYFSNAGINADSGGRVDISGPGVRVYSSYSKNADGELYATLSGTSMATPHVSGVAALYTEAFPELSAEALWLKLEKSAKQLEGQEARDVGSGLTQAPIKEKEKEAIV